MLNEVSWRISDCRGLSMVASLAERPWILTARSHIRVEQLRKIADKGLLAMLDRPPPSCSRLDQLVSERESKQSTLRKSLTK